MTATATRAAGSAPARRAPNNRWLILAIIGTAQLMVVLDVTIVNIALPSAQRDLGFSDDNRQWVDHGLRARLRQPVAPRRTAVRPGRAARHPAGSVCSVSPVPRRSAVPPRPSSTLIAARVLQGCAPRVLAPAALSTLNVTFTDAKERATRLRHLLGDRRRRLDGRADRRRHAHRMAVLALVPVREPGSSPLPAAFGVTRKVDGRAERPVRTRPARCAERVGRAVLSRIRPLAARAGRVGFGRADLAVRRQRRAAGLVRPGRARGANPLLPLRVLADRNRGGPTSPSGSPSPACSAGSCS